MEMVEFWTICATNNIVLDEKMRDNIERYANELSYWNEKINMISRKDTGHVWDRHLLHSLCILKYFDLKEKGYVLDIGTGGGLPGIPVKIARPDLRMTLVDSIAKKAKTTDMFAKHTGLNNLEVKNARVEELDNSYHQKFDYVIARAVAPCLKLINWSKHLLKKDGEFIFLKGGDLGEELKDIKSMYPKANIIQRDIEVLGNDWFKTNDKKVLRIKLNS